MERKGCRFVWPPAERKRKAGEIRDGSSRAVSSLLKRRPRFATLVFWVQLRTNQGEPDSRISPKNLQPDPNPVSVGVWLVNSGS
ncbi:hypothetical protein L484_017793 [Morus notabilis]|uniref:Uncharacterized protein n=1 Tax=Morus notabilis TaxID=981085 RepID=W9QQA9_9ROSA|nr:hypothetical protein L484_017793 [Morus notabilis]